MSTKIGEIKANKTLDIGSKVWYKPQMRVILIRICTSIEQSLLVEPLISVAELQSYSRGIGSELRWWCSWRRFSSECRSSGGMGCSESFSANRRMGCVFWDFFSEIVQKLEPIPRKLISLLLIFFATFSLSGMKWIKVVWCGRNS